MTLPNPPHLYNPPDTRWWWFSWSGPSGRRRQSCQALGLSVDIPADQALEKVKEYLGLIPKSPDPGTETLGWLRTVIAKKPEPNITESTRGVYLRHFDIFIELLGDDFPLSNVKRIPHVARFQEFLLHSGRCTVTANIVCRSVQAVFKRAFELGYMELNPFARFPRLREPDGQLKHLEPEVLDRFLAAVRDWRPAIRRKSDAWYEGMKRLMIIYLYTARRRMEPLAIRRSDIDLAAGTVRVLNAKKRGRPLDTIAIPPSVRHHFAWFLDTFPGDEPFGAYKKYTVSNYCRMWLTLAGLPEDLHLHNLRHTSISLAANQPYANLRAIQQFVGHSTITMTERYTHGRSQGSVDFGREFTIQDDKP